MNINTTKKLRSILSTILAIETLELENRNMLNGTNKERAKEKIEFLNTALSLVNDEINSDEEDDEEE